MQYFLKNIEFVHLSLPPVPSKPSVFASVPVTCVLFTFFFVSTLSLTRLRMKMSACQWVAVEAWGLVKCAISVCMSVCGCHCPAVPPYSKGITPDVFHVGFFQVHVDHWFSPVCALCRMLCGHCSSLLQEGLSQDIGICMHLLSSPLSLLILEIWEGEVLVGLMFISSGNQKWLISRNKYWTLWNCRWILVKQRSLSLITE